MNKKNRNVSLPLLNYLPLQLPPLSDWTSYALFSLVTIVFMSHFLYVLLTYQFPVWDEHLFLEYALKLYDILSRPSIHSFGQINEVIQLRQPLYPLSLVIPLLFFGTEYAYKLALLVNGFYFAATIIGIYFLGREFFNRTSSFVAAFLYSVYGFPLYYLHFTYSETAATTWIVYSLLFLRKSQYFLKRKETILFGLFLAFSLLTRWTTPVFIIGPFLLTLTISLWMIFKNQKKVRSRILRNGGLLVLFGLILPSLIYYGPKFSVFYGYLANASKDSTQWVSTLYYLSPELSNTFSTRSVMFYFNILSQQTVFLFAIFVLGFLLCLRYIKSYAFFILAFVVPYSFFTFITVFKDDRFIVPLYPAMALISAVVVQKTTISIFRTLLLLFIFITGILAFFGSSWGMGPMGKQGLKDIVLPEFIHHPRRIYLTPMVWPPSPDHTSAPVIISAIEKDWDSTEPPVIVFGFRNDAVDSGFCKILCYEKRHLSSNQQIKGLADKDYTSMFKVIQKADYILIKNKNATDERFFEPMVTRLNMSFEQGGKLPDAFYILNTIHVRVDDSNITIYKRMADITKEDLAPLANTLSEIYPEDKDIIKSAIDSL